MSLTTNTTFEAEIIGGIFSNHEMSADAKEAAQHWNAHDQTIQVIFHLDDREAREAYIEALVNAIRSGNILVPVANGTHSARVIEAIEDLPAEHNPDTSAQTRKLILLKASMPGSDADWCSLSC